MSRKEIDITDYKKQFTGAHKILTDELIEKQVFEKRNEKEWNGCMGCGDCCTMLNFKVIPESRDNDFSLAHYGKLENVPSTVLVAHNCQHLDLETKKCKVYKNRPKTCRDFLCNASRTRARMLEQLNIKTKGKGASEQEIKKHISEIGEKESLRNPLTEGQP
jgi:Fe-S-cluster containining protein